jgi:hypothetical protein
MHNFHCCAKYIATNNKTNTLRKVPDIVFTILSIFEFSGQVFLKFPSNKFHWNPSNGRAGRCYLRKDGQTDVTKLMEAFHDGNKASKSI